MGSGSEFAILEREKKLFYIGLSTLFLGALGQWGLGTFFRSAGAWVLFRSPSSKAWFSASFLSFGTTRHANIVYATRHRSDGEYGVLKLPNSSASIS